MIHIVHPEALLLAIPALVLVWRSGPVRPLATIARVLLVLCGTAMLAGLEHRSGDEGRDLVVLVDRSRSVGEAGPERAREIARTLAASAREGDRIALVGFAREAVLDASPVDARLARFDGTPRAIDMDATDLAAGIERALAVIPSHRPGAIAIVSDGESTGRTPIAAARAALARGVRIDAFPIRRTNNDHIAVESVETPGEIGAGEPFRITAWVWNDVDREADWEVRRDGEKIAGGRRAFGRGADRLLLRDRLVTPGIAHYEVVVGLDHDGRPENNTATTSLRIVAAPRVLLVSPGGRSGRLASALAGAGIPLDVVAPGTAPLTPDRLDPYAAVILENVAAEELPAHGLEALRDFVISDGGGLLMTGGEHSFGLGGYRLSAVEDVLPVSMQIRQEQRRYALALAIALDRSGSMAMPVGDGRTKMDLANLGAVAAVEMLSTIDEVSVIAVDSAPHVVVPMGALATRSTAVEQIRSIESGGGGIFVGAAIHEMARQLEKATVRARHMILFADANDSEEPEDSRDLLPKLRAAGVTLSVIAMGEETDQDAELLRDLARLGGGRCRFVKDVGELPRVFAQETTESARSSFADQPVGVDVRAGLLALGDLPLREFHDVGGYSIAWPRDEAQIGLVTRDDLHAPLLSAWQRGLGRSASFLGEVDGRYSGALGAWAGFSDLFATLARWLSGNQKGGALWAGLERQGHEGVLRVELGRDAEGQSDLLRAVVRGPDGVSSLWLEQVDLGRFEGRFALHGDGAWRAVVQLGDHGLVRTAPISLPYSPEFEPRPDPAAGENLLREVTEHSGGRIDPPLDSLFDGPRAPLGVTSLGPLLAWLLLAFLLLEIAVRRLELGPAVVARRIRPTSAARPRAKPTVVAPIPTSAAASATESPPSKSEAPSEPATSGDLLSALDRARRRSRR